MANRKGIEFKAFYDDRTFCGITYYCYDAKTLYLSYLAVDDTLRSSGYGSRILSWIEYKYPDLNIILNVEPLDENADNYDQRVKRMKFYEKNGFKSSGWGVVDPSGVFDTLMTAENADPEDLLHVFSVSSFGLYKPELRKTVS